VKKLIVFDLDGTLAESKVPLDNEMAALLTSLLTVVQVAVISGGDWAQFQTELLSNLPNENHLSDLSLLPTCGSKFYRYSGAWKLIYSEDLTAVERRKIVASLQSAIAAAGFKTERIWGETIEDRGSQITYSALGQQAPLDEKRKWDPQCNKRNRIKELLEPLIPEFSVRLGGTTSIDITKAGIDKAYGIRKLHENLGISLDQMIFVGDALFPGGNDYPVKQTGVDSIRVRDPDETKRVIEAIIACLRRCAA
jgi:HAD superfamily hydrolase (TIGR01484 family)